MLTDAQKEERRFRIMEARRKREQKAWDEAPFILMEFKPSDKPYALWYCGQINVYNCKQEFGHKEGYWFKDRDIIEFADTKERYVFIKDEIRPIKNLKELVYMNVDKDYPNTSNDFKEGFWKCIIASGGGEALAYMIQKYNGEF